MKLEPALFKTGISKLYELRYQKFIDVKMSQESTSYFFNNFVYYYIKKKTSTFVYYQKAKDNIE